MQKDAEGAWIKPLTRQQPAKPPRLNKQVWPAKRPHPAFCLGIGSPNRVALGKDTWTAGSKAKHFVTVVLFLTSFAPPLLWSHVAAWSYSIEFHPILLTVQVPFPSTIRFGLKNDRTSLLKIGSSFILFDNDTLCHFKMAHELNLLSLKWRPK